MTHEERAKHFCIRVRACDTFRVMLRSAREELSAGCPEESTRIRLSRALKEEAQCHDWDTRLNKSMGYPLFTNEELDRFAATLIEGLKQKR